MDWRPSKIAFKLRRFRWVLLFALLIWAGIDPHVWWLLSLIALMLAINWLIPSPSADLRNPVWLNERGVGFDYADQEIALVTPFILLPGLCICRIQQVSNDSDKGAPAPLWLWRWADQCDPDSWTRFCRIVCHCRQQPTAISRY
ncbi:hypothetical protein [Aliidiomarina indica]|uniref:hypothetical protein n=1 Tax=Aliidiomarina indica TaxID=2749147 RepID=UPI00188DEC4E|nr:hypothetical protein [Aliidiomarina indica]